MDVDAQKRAAAARAVEFVRPGMRLGLGTGSTAKHFVELLAERVHKGLDVVAVPTSEATRALAEKLGVSLTTLTRRLSSTSPWTVPTRSGRISR
jgi:ribose 5-phosphate isomerase A